MYPYRRDTLAIITGGDTKENPALGNAVAAVGQQVAAKSPTSSHEWQGKLLPEEKKQHVFFLVDETQRMETDAKNILKTQKELQLKTFQTTMRSHKVKLQGVAAADRRNPILGMMAGEDKQVTRADTTTLGDELADDFKKTSLRTEFKNCVERYEALAVMRGPLTIAQKRERDEIATYLHGLVSIARDAIDDMPLPGWDVHKKNWILDQLAHKRSLMCPADVKDVTTADAGFNFKNSLLDVHFMNSNHPNTLIPDEKDFSFAHIRAGVATQNAFLYQKAYQGFCEKVADNLIEIETKVFEDKILTVRADEIKAEFLEGGESKFTKELTRVQAECQQLTEALHIYFEGGGIGGQASVGIPNEMARATLIAILEGAKGAHDQSVDYAAGIRTALYKTRTLKAVSLELQAKIDTAKRNIEAISTSSFPVMESERTKALEELDKLQRAKDAFLATFVHGEEGRIDVERKWSTAETKLGDKGLSFTYKFKADADRQFGYVDFQLKVQGGHRFEPSNFRPELTSGGLSSTQRITQATDHRETGYQAVMKDEFKKQSTRLKPELVSYLMAAGLDDPAWAATPAKYGSYMQNVDYWMQGVYAAMEVSFGDTMTKQYEEQESLLRGLGEGATSNTWLHQIKAIRDSTDSRFSDAKDKVALINTMIKNHPADPGIVRLKGLLERAGRTDEQVGDLKDIQSLAVNNLLDEVPLSALLIGSEALIRNRDIKDAKTETKSRTTVGGGGAAVPPRALAEGDTFYGRTLVLEKYSPATRAGGGGSAAPAALQLALDKPKWYKNESQEELFKRCEKAAQAYIECSFKLAGKFLSPEISGPMGKKTIWTGGLGLRHGRREQLMLGAIFKAMGFDARIIWDSDPNIRKTERTYYDQCYTEALVHQSKQVSEVKKDLVASSATTPGRAAELEELKAGLDVTGYTAQQRVVSPRR